MDISSYLEHKQVSELFSHIYHFSVNLRHAFFLVPGVTLHVPALKIEESRFSHIYSFSVNLWLAFFLGARARPVVPVFEESRLLHIYHFSVNLLLAFFLGNWAKPRCTSFRKIHNFHRSMILV